MVVTVWEFFLHALHAHNMLFFLYSGVEEEDDEANEKTMMYYVNDGVYGSFNCILYDHAECLPILHTVR